MSTEEPTRQLVIFSLGSEEYALPITRVQEIIRYTEPRSVASQTPWIRGVINLRGNIVPVCDLAERLGLGLERPEGAKIVILETASGTAGVIVDDVDEVLTVTAEQLEDIPSADAGYVDGVAKVGDRRSDPAQLAQDVDPVPARHGQVEREDVGPVQGAQLEGLVTVAADADHLRSALRQRVGDQTAHERGVIGDDDADGL